MPHLVDLTAQHPLDYKAFFTEGLHRHPDCFRISPADEAREAFPTAGTPDSFTLGSVTATGQLAGVVSFQREGATRERLRHGGLLFRMYVGREFGGQGIGRQLIQEVLARAAALGDVEHVNLTVISSNAAARRLYEQFDFVAYGTAPRTIKQGAVYYDETLMTKRLSI